MNENLPCQWPACKARSEDTCTRCEVQLCEKHCYGRGDGPDAEPEVYCFDCVGEHDDFEER